MCAYVYIYIYEAHASTFMAKVGDFIVQQLICTSLANNYYKFRKKLQTLVKMLDASFYYKTTLSMAAVIIEKEVC